MTLDSARLDAFSVLAQTRKFTKAAEKLHITQSALSQRIKNLEEDLETTLFIRDRSGVRLTDGGQKLLQYCQLRETVEADVLSQMKTGTTGHLAGTIRIAGFSTVMSSFVPQALQRLVIEHHQVNLMSMTREIKDLPDMLKGNEADFILLNYPLGLENMVHVELGEEQNVLVGKKGVNFSSPTYLDHDHEDQTTFNYFKLCKTGIPLRCRRHFLGNIHGIIQGIRLGLGHAVVPLHLIQGMKDIQIFNPNTIYRVPVILHYYRQPYYTKLHQIVVKLLKENFAQILTQQPMLKSRNCALPTPALE